MVFKKVTDHQYASVFLGNALHALPLGSCQGQRPPAVPIDADRQDLVTTGVDGFEHMAGRHARHLVLGAAAAEEPQQAPEPSAEKKGILH